MSDPDVPKRGPREEVAAPETKFDPASAAATILRRAQQLKKPTDWQDFQFRCTILFQDELSDPHCKEYGRGGQDQGGIDILGRRGDRHVGIQCRLVAKPLTRQKMLEDVEAALALPFDFAEIIFATTAPDATQATQAAHSIEQTLRGRGKDTKVEVYGWGALQQLIARHDRASAIFNPEVLGRQAEQRVNPDVVASLANIERLTELVASQTSKILDSSSDDKDPKKEDPALHARIDAFRDIMLDGEPKLAYDKLTDLIATSQFAEAPYALFRAKTNLASAAHDIGKNKEAVALWSEAAELRKEDPRAISNLALSRLIEGRVEEAVTLAREALSMDGKCPEAVSVLLQATARSDWQGSPNDIVPNDLLGNEQVDASLLEFKRLRGDRSWIDDARRLLTEHQHPHFRYVAALAVLDRVTGSGGYLPGTMSSLLPGELALAADTLKANFEKILRFGTPDPDDLTAAANNSALALRLAGRFSEAIQVLHSAIQHVRRNVLLIRLLGIVQALDGDVPEGIATLASIPEDEEAQLARAEMVAGTDRQAALGILISINGDNLHPAHREVRASLWTELALSLGGRNDFERGLTELRTTALTQTPVELFVLEGRVRFDNLDMSEARKALSALADNLDADEPIMTRIAVAQKLSAWGDSIKASEILDGHIDLTRPTEATKFYLEALAAARRDEAFDRVLAESDQSVRSDPSILWISAAHAWNMGDINKTALLVDELLEKDRENLRVALLKVDILNREDRALDVKTFLDRPLETYRSTRLSDRFRLVQILQHFGSFARASALAYKLYLENRDQSRAWMTIATVVLARGDSAEAAEVLRIERAGPNAAVDIEFDDGEKRRIIIEPDAKLRALDGESLEPEHELCTAVHGLNTGELFELPDGKIGEVVQLRHKFIARFHDVLSQYEARFPTIFGFRSVSVNFESKDGLNEVIGELKERHDFVTEATLEYANGPSPLAILAHRVGVDIIDAASGVLETGNKIKVCVGVEVERAEAERAISENVRKGCILDPLVFWTAFRLGALEAVEATCGPIHLAPRTMDLLRDRKVKMLATSHDGHRSMAYRDGQIALSELPREAMVRLAAEIDAAIAWAQANATILPVQASDALPEPVRRFLQSGRSDMLDECVIALQSHLLLVCDDGPIRGIASHLGVCRSAWLQAVLIMAVANDALPMDRYVVVLASLLDDGQTYLGLSGSALVGALALDAAINATKPGIVFCKLAGALGGKLADPVSHASVTLEVLSVIWREARFKDLRMPATGILLRSVIRGRSEDYRAILGALMSRMISGGRLEAYTAGWLRGHFLSLS